MAAQSAGVLPYRIHARIVEVLLVHPGGPFWRNRDQGAWQLAKGLIEPGESPEAAARREAQEELGVALNGVLASLGTLRQSGGKTVHGFATPQDIDPAAVRSNRFELEWPPRSGRVCEFPEVDAVRWMGMAEADAMILPSQRPFLERLRAMLKPD